MSDLMDLYDAVLGIVMFIVFAVGLPLLLFSVVWGLIYACTHDWWIE